MLLSDISKSQVQFYFFFLFPESLLRTMTIYSFTCIYFCGEKENYNRITQSNQLAFFTGKSGLGPGGLLLATLPLILAPMLSYLFTPMVIPVTATIAAGRRRKRSTMKTSNSLRYPYNKKMDQLAYHLHHLLFNSTSSSYLTPQ